MMSESFNNQGVMTMTMLTAPESVTHDQSAETGMPNQSKQRVIESVPLAEQDFRQRNHRYSALPVKTLLKVRMRDLDLTNSDLQRVMGYDRPNVVAMMRSGSMRLPVSKVAEVAKTLQVDPVFLLGKVLAENDAALWDVIASIMGDRLITANEMALITQVREVLDGHDVNFAEAPEFVAEVTAALAEIVDRQNALTQAAVVAIDEPVNR
jgi:hypothetical protein